MESINSLRASNGSENASVATVQSPRSSLATTLVVDTVQGIPTNFYGSMGKPHTFVDPVTSETITVISEATAVDFKGHVDGTNLEIDTIAPGYTDNGSSVNDIVIIKPTTQWANGLADTLEVSHNDDGTLKDNIITTSKVADGAITSNKIDFGGGGAGIWWEEIGRTTLTSTSDTISVPSLPLRKYLKIITEITPTGGSVGDGLRFNNDSSSNYALRYSTNGASDGTTLSQQQLSCTNAGSTTAPTYSETSVVNIASAEKICTAVAIDRSSAGAGTAPSKRESAGKWVNTSSQINRVDLVNVGGSGDYSVGSTVIVLGHN